KLIKNTTPKYLRKSAFIRVIRGMGFGFDFDFEFSQKPKSKSQRPLFRDQRYGFAFGGLLLFGQLLVANC
ncbi:MAG: hypothetical protein ACRD72_05030, partial [Candidatus Angelobacter sp.]